MKHSPKKATFENLNPKLIKDLRNKSHSLGTNPAIPQLSDKSIEERIMEKRFKTLVNNYKKHFNTNVIIPSEVVLDFGETFIECLDMEQEFHGELIKLAIAAVQEELGFTDEDITIKAELVSSVSLANIQKEPDYESKLDFNRYTDIDEANKEVYKRRFINAMIQGSSNKYNHMFHMMADELDELNPRLTNIYSRLMSVADYGYMIFDDKTQTIPGGVVKVQFPKTENDKPIIHAQALVFPVLIQEIIKGAMEILAMHGLPNEKEMAEYVISKADYIDAEKWDIRLGPGLWELFIEAIPEDAFEIKHLIFMEVVKLSCDDFNDLMKEVLTGTQRGKTVMQTIANKLKNKLRNDEFDSVMGEF